MSVHASPRRQNRTRARVIDSTMTVVIRGTAVSLVLLLAFIVVKIIGAGLPELNLHFLTSPPKALDPGGGIGPQLFNSAYILLLSLLITAPIGMAAGIYLAELAPANRLTSALSVATETLATLPSIVVGLFGLLVFVELTHWSFTRLGGALALTVINLPYAVRVTEDALRAVPDALREGSLSVGATRWQTIRRVLLPAALPSLITGLILISGRAFGEAAGAPVHGRPVGAASLSHPRSVRPGRNPGRAPLRLSPGRLGPRRKPHRRRLRGGSPHHRPGVQYHRALRGTDRSA